MDCPRCRLLLADAEYEGQHVQFCGTCWGYWLTRSQLEQIVSGGDYRFGKDEAKTVARSLATHGDANRHGAEQDAVHCPVCSGAMERKSFTPACPVQIDECAQHGVWLDTGEIKDLQVFVEQRMR